MRLSLCIIISGIFFAASASYGMEKGDGSSPSSTTMSISDVYGVAIFIGCCIRDIPHYIAYGLTQQEEPHAEIVRCPRSPSWGQDMASAMTTLNTKTRNN